MDSRVLSIRSSVLSLSFSPPASSTSPRPPPGSLALPSHSLVVGSNPVLHPPIMVAEFSSAMANCTDVVSGQSDSRSMSTAKHLKKKVPKKQHKAIREKMKRDHLNDLFVELDQALNPTRENNGKASILVEATRILRDLVAQVETLGRENVALVNECQYVNGEKNELQEEKNFLKAEVERLQNELERLQSDPIEELRNKLDLAPPMLPHSFPPMPMMQPSAAAPHFDVALQDDGTSPSSLNAPLKVSRPYARYPSPSDVWSLELLSGNKGA